MHASLMVHTATGYTLSSLKVGTISNPYSATVQWRLESANTLQRIQLEQVIPGIFLAHYLTRELTVVMM